ncbi:DUF1028 domain-containing protein [Pelagibius marinus]|uniref:DUF1028 domain-containing protein n=1 Tax=Pelagibius marinus TaxID=2762760 RepID=UPI0018727B61|nr:DUF1028 domain-containing protein [Pelagibius marinus]
MTFSIAAHCPDTGMFGVAVSSSSPAVAARCAFVRPRTGAVLSQNITDPRLGTRLLDLLGEGASAEDAVATVAKTAEHIAYRQLIAVDGRGGSAVYSGSHALGIVGEARGRGVASGGNLLTTDSIPQVIVDAFLASRGHLAARLLTALQAAVAAGGEAGPVHSAGLSVVGEVDWPIADLRVDWTENCPVAELTKLWQLYEPQLEAYVTRALDPSAAPRYGVPGDR